MGRAMFSAAVRRGTRWKLWNTKPMRWLRTRACSSGESVVTSRPSRRYRPVLGLSSRPSRFKSVDLPEPDGPITATYSPALMDRFRLRRACPSESPRWKPRSMPASSICAGFISPPDKPPLGGRAPPRGAANECERGGSSFGFVVNHIGSAGLHALTLQRGHHLVTCGQAFQHLGEFPVG